MLPEPETRERFLASPQEIARAAGLTEQEAAALIRIDRAGLQMTAESLRRKRESRKPPGRARRGWRRWFARWR